MLKVFCVVLIVFIYLLVNMFLAAWICRSWSFYRRMASVIFEKQLRSISGTWVWIISFLHISSMALLFFSLNNSFNLFWFSVIVLGYVFLVSSLTLSVFSKINFFRILWADVFFRIALLVLPVFVVYLARGYASVMVGDILKIHASTVPMASIAAICIFLLTFVSLLLSVFALMFEVAFLTVFSKIGDKKRKSTGKIFPVLFSLNRSSDVGILVHTRVHLRKIGMAILLFMSFLASYTGVHVATMGFSKNFVEIILSAIVFEFDAGPANKCALTEEEMKLVVSTDPVMKVIPVPSNHERAFLISRKSDLFRKISWNQMKVKSAEQRGIIFHRMVDCYK